MSSKVSRTVTSTKCVSQRCLSDEWDILLTNFEPVERTQEKTKYLVYQCEFINFQALFQHKYYSSNNTHFQVQVLCF